MPAPSARGAANDGANGEPAREEEGIRTGFEAIPERLDGNCDCDRVGAFARLTAVSGACRNFDRQNISVIFSKRQLCDGMHKGGFGAGLSRIGGGRRECPRKWGNAKARWRDGAMERDLPGNRHRHRWEIRGGFWRAQSPYTEARPYAATSSTIQSRPLRSKPTASAKIRSTVPFRSCILWPSCSLSCFCLSPAPLRCSSEERPPAGGGITAPAIWRSDPRAGGEGSGLIVPNHALKTQKLQAAV